MPEYQNIDDIVEDAVICIEMCDHNHSTKWSNIPEIAEEVSLDTDNGYRMKVNVMRVFADKNIICGEVIQEYFHKNKNKRIKVGDLVEFSKKKVAVIHRPD
ncbi:hypothetical protein KAI46_09080 [bacterium]|nr:hypothetical protein [bacterium]